MMKLALILIVHCISFVASLNATTPVKFYAMSDGPLGHRERSRLADQLRALDSRAEFVVHLGDIHERQVTCDDGHFQVVADSLREHLLMPALVLPGDNDYYECDDQVKAFEKWTGLFLDFEGHWSPSFSLARQTEQRENFAFVLKNVLFIGVHVINASVRNWESWNLLIHHDSVWLEESILNHVNQVEAVVVMSHAFPQNNRRYKEFYETFVRLTAIFSGKPFIYLQGDEKKFAVDQIFPSQNVFRIVLDQNGVMDPTEIIVDTAHGTTPFKIKRRALS